MEWIDPFPNETIEAYAKRLSEGIDQNQPFVLIGLSFGGMVAVEIAKITLPVCTIQISSVDHRDELPKLYRFIGKTGITRLLLSSALISQHRLQHSPFKQIIKSYYQRS